MKKEKAFTLVELLVVIAIIALLMSILVPALTKARHQAKTIVCRSNLHQYALAGTMYLAENDERFPDPYTWLYKNMAITNPYTSAKLPEPDGPFWKYVKAKEVHMCPAFSMYCKNLSLIYKCSYSMNAYFGKPGYGAQFGGNVVERFTLVRKPSEVFFFSEENLWLVNKSRGAQYNLSNFEFNDNNLLVRSKPYTSNIYTDSFATYHNPPGGNKNRGLANIAFADGSAGSIWASEQADGDTNFGGFSKAWPLRMTKEMMP